MTNEKRSNEHKDINNTNKGANSMTSKHPLKQLAELYGQDITSIAPGEPIENTDGEPVGMTSQIATTGGLMGMIITQREADAAGIAYDTEGVTIVNSAGDVISSSHQED